jgi:D-psicose/D-tagatose/L-ribulose 3-epimerase
MKFGISAFGWTGAIRKSHSAVLEFVRETGFEVFEIPMFDPRDLPVRDLVGAYEANGLECTVCCILPPQINPISPDFSTRERSKEHLLRCVDTAAELGATLLGGPIFAPIGYLPGHRVTRDERQWAIDAFQSISALLDDTNITLSLEPVNRAETFFLRTAAEAADLVDAIGHPRIGVTVDTFHANIEEKNTPAAIDALGPRLKHIHLSENDRGLLGTGHVDFAAIDAALRRNQYHGCLIVEGFGYCLDDPSSPGYLWANQTVTPRLLATESMAYLTRLESRLPSGSAATR